MLRVCSCFYPFAPKFAHLLCSLPFLLSLYLPDRVALSLCLCGSLGVVVVSFSLSDYTQKERARRVGASSLRVLWVVLAFFLPSVTLLH